jgi:hypothetical protein
MVWNRHERRDHAVSHRLMIAMDTRACRPTILDPSRPHPTRPRRPLGPAEAPGLLTSLATIGDPRAPKGRRHPLVATLAMAAAAV